MASEFEPLLPRGGHRPATGGWKSALFIIWVEVAERFAYYGISGNLISYLTGPLGQSTAAAAAGVNAWSGAASMLPLLGAAVADSWLGRYRTIVVSSVLYIAGLGMLALSSMFPSPEATQAIGFGVFAQPPTLFTKQAATLDRRVGSSGFQIPPAALQCFSGTSMIICVVLYDRVLVPVARRVSGVALGITMLQRIGTGMALVVAALVIAALVEMRRLSTAMDAGMVDQPDAVVPMSLWWIMPQYVLIGAADVFTMVGMQEFFYDQMPSAFKSLGLALYLSVLGVGSFMSSFLIWVIDGLTKKGGGTSWLADNLNRGHLDYFYLLIAALTALELLAFLYFSASYAYKRKTANVH